MEKHKTCFRCGEDKPLSDYYAHKQMGDGRLGKCKVCTRRDQEIRVAFKKATDPKWVFDEKERCRLKSKPHKSNRKPVDKNGAKYKARCAAGHLPKKEGHQNHHWSYNPEHYKDIIQLEVKDHAKIHRYMKYDSDHLMYRTVHGVLLDSKELALSYYEKVLPIRDGVYSELQKLF
jgi:hypothetical protein